LNLKEPRRSHHSLLEHQPVSLGRHHRRQPVARDWHTTRKRLTATVACMNTALLGLIIGIYAGEVPSIQYYLADQTHTVILGNVVLYLGMALTTLLSWPLPLLHGRRRYLLTAISLAVPLQFPQALAVQSYRSPTTPAFRAALLVPRALLGLALGVANVNCIAVLLDLFGASLQSKVPHQEIVTGFDLRRHGGGLGLWLGWWTWCSIGSLAVGFWVGASIIETMNPAWGFYVVVVLAAGFLLLNVLCPETRRARFRRTVGEFVTEEEEVRRWVARGEVKLHVYQVGPKWWFEELVAGLVLMKRMLNQTGFLVVAVFTAWIYAQIVLVIVLLGALLSRAYVLKASYVGLGVFAIAIGAFLAIPLSKANILSRSRKKGQRTDSMTFEHDVTWSSHMVRRLVFTTILPIAGIAYTIVSVVRKMHWIGPIIFAGFIGFFSNLAIAECNGLIMETFDTSDLQPGVNSKHRLQSLAVDVRRRRTNYSSYPRISAGIFATQGLSFLFAAGATGIGGKATRELGAPLTTGIWAAILMGLTVLLALVLWRFKSVRVIPGQAFGTRAGTRTSTAWGASAEDDWKPVVVGNPSGKMRRMNLLELGRLSRWVEIRRLNKLQKD
ncbi:MFS general substrate transporter, partial [Viridothelium virens]